MNSVDLSVVIISYNSADFLRECLNSLYSFIKDVTFEIIVVDNASTDGTIELVRKEFENVIIVENRENTGYSAAINHGIERAKGEYCAIMNPDTRLTSNVFDPLLNYLKTNPKSGVVGCSLKFADGRSQRSYFRFPSLLGRLAYHTGINRLVNAESINRATTPEDLSTPVNVEVVSGAFFTVKREIILSVGGFDTDYFLYHEEADLCFRLQKAGYQNALFPGLSLIHHGWNTESPKNALVYFHRNRSLLLFFYKNRSRIALWVLMKMNILFLLLRYLLNFLPANSRSVRKHKRKSIISVLQYHFKFVIFLAGNSNNAFP